MSLAATIQPDPALVLAKATLRAAQALGLSHACLARILGTSAATVSRLARGRPLAPGSKEGELALLVVRAYRSLDAVVGAASGPAGGDAPIRPALEAALQGVEPRRRRRHASPISSPTDPP